MNFFPGSGAGGRGFDWLFEPGIMARTGVGLMVILLLLTIYQRRTLKGGLQVVLIACAFVLALLPAGDLFALVYYVPFLITGIGLISFFLARANEQIG